MKNILEKNLQFRICKLSSIKSQLNKLELFKKSRQDKKKDCYDNECWFYQRKESTPATVTLRAEFVKENITKK